MASAAAVYGVCGEMLFKIFPIGGDPAASLARRAAAGDAAAFGELYREYRGMVARIALNVTGSRGDVEDLIQETFLQVHRSIGSFHGESKLSTWLYRIAVNVCLQHVRQSRRRAAVSAEARAEEGREPAVTHTTPESEALDGEKRRALVDALEALPEKKRAVFVLHELSGMGAREIAGVLGIPTLTVRTRLFYARKAIYHALVDHPAFAGETKGKATA